MTLTTARQTFHVNGVDLAWAERGSGPAGTPTLVLCHGFTGSSLDFALDGDALAADRRVVTLDQRGHGHSTRTGRLEGYTIEQLAADLGAFLEAVGGGPVDLLGHSMGGRVVMGVVAGPAGPRALADPHGHERLVLHPARRGDARARPRLHRRVRPVPGACRRRSSLGGPEDALIEASTPPEWQQEKDAIFAGMDAYAVKGLGTELMGADAARDNGQVTGVDLAVHRLPDHRHRGRARPPAGRPGAGAGRPRWRTAG